MRALDMEEHEDTHTVLGHEKLTIKREGERESEREGKGERERE